MNMKASEWLASRGHGRQHGHRLLPGILVLSCAVSLLACKAEDNVLEPDPIALTENMDVVDNGTPGPDAGGDANPILDSDAHCDLSGVWLGRMVTYSLALSLQQTANNWYFYEFSQEGETLTVTDHMDCGVEVTGTVDVTLSAETTVALSEHNRQLGRQAIVQQVDNYCELDMGRFWSVRGANEEAYVSSQVGTKRNDTKSVLDLSTSTPLPDEDNLDGHEDWDQDDNAGIAWSVSGIVMGTRHSVQRDWTEYYTAPGYQIEAGGDWNQQPFRVRAEFDNEENILAAMPDNGLLNSPSRPDYDAEHYLELKRIALDRDADEASPFVDGEVLGRCQAIRQALPR